MSDSSHEYEHEHGSRQVSQENRLSRYYENTGDIHEEYAHPHPPSAWQHGEMSYQKPEEDLYMTGDSRRTGDTRSVDDGDEYDSASVMRPAAEVHAQYTGWRAIYYNPVIQVFFLGFVCFMGPGLFNALNGLGGGGMFDPTTSANANSTLYATFAVAAFFAG